MMIWYIELNRIDSKVCPPLRIELNSGKLASSLHKSHVLCRDSSLQLAWKHAGATKSFIPSGRSPFASRPRNLYILLLCLFMYVCNSGSREALLMPRQHPPETSSGRLSTRAHAFSSPRDDHSFLCVHPWRSACTGTLRCKTPFLLWNNMVISAKSSMYVCIINGREGKRRARKK